MFRTILFVAVIGIFVVSVSAQTTAFIYQGSLKDGPNVANGNYDFEFKLFDAASAGSQQGSTIQRLNVTVANGIFTVSLDFGAGTLPGDNRFLDIAVRTSGEPSFTPFSPRQRVASVPYAVRSLNATSADSVAAGGISAGSGNYIQNTTSPQVSSNFNISGTGTANVINAGSRFNLNGNHILSSPGIINLFAGSLTGQANTTGAQNSFFGGFAGSSNTAGNNNSFFGTSAGTNNTTGSNNAFFGSGAGVANNASTNSFFGISAGQSNTNGSENSFFGGYAGQSNTTGNNNSFFGRNAGVGNTLGGDNSFFGHSAGSSNTSGTVNAFFGNNAGDSNTTGINNSFFGGNAGSGNTTGNGNAFFGLSAGITNTTGSANSLFGVGSNVMVSNLTNASAIGRWAAVSASDSLVLGSIVGLNGAPVNTKVGIGTSNPTTNLHVQNGGSESGRIQVGGLSTGGEDKIITFGDTFCVNLPGCVYIGERTTDDVMELRADTFNFLDGEIQINSLGAAGSTHLCLNANSQVSGCSSSLRYKTNLATFSSGLSLVHRLRPITFDWKEGGMHDLGLGAEDVAAIEPLLVTYNAKGEVEGVKYDRIGVVLVNAVKEQQKIIESQQAQIDALKKLVCLTNKDAEICREK